GAAASTRRLGEPPGSGAAPIPSKTPTMNNRLFAAGLAILAACASLLLPACTPGDGGAAAAPVDLGTVENPIRVVPTLDSGHAVTQTIGFAGGTITATGADGTVIYLAVPVDALLP